MGLRRVVEVPALVNRWITSAVINPSLGQSLNPTAILRTLNFEKWANFEGGDGKMEMKTGRKPTENRPQTDRKPLNDKNPPHVKRYINPH